MSSTSVTPPPRHTPPLAPPARRALRVLHLEDSEVDHELAMAWLARDGRSLQTLRVDTEAGFRAALEEDWDAVLSDYNLPGFSGLTALKFDLAWIARHSSDAEVVQRAQSALEMAGHAIEASQRVMHNLRPAILEQGLVAALQWMAQRFERRTGIECTFRTSHDDLPLPAGVPLVTYRAVQEALTNVSKHAQASRVSIDLSLARGVLSVEVSDNGRGLAADDLAKAKSFGIRGLRERADTVSGWVDLTSNTADAGTDKSGTTMILSVPVRARAGLGSDSQFDAASQDDAAFDDEDGEDARHNPSSWSPP